MQECDCAQFDFRALPWQRIARQQRTCDFRLYRIASLSLPPNEREIDRESGEMWIITGIWYDILDWLQQFALTHSMVHALRSNRVRLYHRFQISLEAEHFDYVIADDKTESICTVFRTQNKIKCVAQMSETHAHRFNRWHSLYCIGVRLYASVVLIWR